MRPLTLVTSGEPLSDPIARESPRIPAVWGWLAAAVLLAPRLLHLTGPLDDPNSWRQCDTIVYTRGLERGGLDVLHPVVCWLGGHRTLILECPLPEALAALLHRAFGLGLVWDRLVTLAAFGISALYLYRIARRISGARIAAWTLLATLALPLGQFYSRAPQVDFAASALAFAFLFHGMVALERRSATHALLAGVCGALGAVIKAPYLVPVAAPLALAALASPGMGARAVLVPVLGIPAAAFMVWYRYMNAVNAAVPDWSFLPGFYREVNAYGWYFGTNAQRLDAANWIKIARRLVIEVATPVGVLLALPGLGWGASRADGRMDARAFVAAWLAGVVAYLTVFFNLNVVHNYYQIPALAPAALAIALGIEALDRRFPRPLRLGTVAFALLAIAALVIPVYYRDYRVDWRRVEGGTAIAAHVPPGQLVIACERRAGWSDPRLLARADRDGWPLALGDLTAERVTKLENLGARWLAILSETGAPPDTAPAFLAGRPETAVPIAHRGKALGTLVLIHLDRAPR